jgi:hypothetical protein
MRVFARRIKHALDVPVQCPQHADAPIQCGMSAIRSPAVRSPAHDDREKRARHRRVDLIVVMARPSRIIPIGVTCPPVNYARPELGKGSGNDAQLSNLDSPVLGGVERRNTRLEHAPSNGSSNKRPQLPRLGLFL